MIFEKFLQAASCLFLMTLVVITVILIKDAIVATFKKD